MNLSLKTFTLRHYIRHVRRQSKHVQHVHAVVFAGTITALIALVILYTEYGFWHETYRAEDSIATEETTTFNPESPGRSLLEFFKEAKDRFSAIGSEGSLLEGKETYTKEAE